MSNDTTITVVGNLVAHPILKFLPSGRAVANVRVASTPRYRDASTAEWKDAAPLFITCNVWGRQAENVTESLQRGHKVIVRGRLKQRSYETADGRRRTVMEIDVEHIGPSLQNATARIAKAQRLAAPPAVPRNGPLSAPQAEAASPSDPWSDTAVPTTAGAGTTEPPF